MVFIKGFSGDLVATKSLNIQNKDDYAGHLAQDALRYETLALWS